MNRRKRILAQVDVTELGRGGVDKFSEDVDFRREVLWSSLELTDLEKGQTTHSP
jgi:hypothetical protein